MQPKQALFEPYVNGLECSPLSTRKTDSGVGLFHRRVTRRWLAISGVLALLLALYLGHPWYASDSYTVWRQLFTVAFGLWLTLGLFYTHATVRRFSTGAHLLRDGGLHLLLLTKAARKQRLSIAFRNRRIRTTVLGIIVKAFFAPLMASFLASHWVTLSNAWAGHHDFSTLFHPSRWNVGSIRWGMDFFYQALFAIDCLWALLGYCSESRWLGNKTLSVEPTVLGWAAALLCYPPFNQVTGAWLPLYDGPKWLHGEWLMLGLRLLILVCFTVYVLATVSFGFKFSNLTHRGVVARGPYRFIRHPAYAAKCLAWWLEHLPTLTLSKAFFLTLTCGLYALRAWTEERHLARDPAYVAYRKKVRWAAIPGVF